VLLAAATGLHAGTPGPGAADPNQIPNASLHGSGGASAATGGTATGTVPTLWRAFALAGSAIATEVVPLPAGALFAGSPPTNAVRVTVSAFGTDQGFDHATALFPLLVDRDYTVAAYIRSGNGDSSPQGVTIGFPLFGADGVFNGRSPGSFSTSAGSNWTLVNGPAFTSLAGDAYGHLSVRLANDDGEDSVLIALPQVQGPPLLNAVPNPAFSGASGASQGSVVGAVPDSWRAFAVGSGSLDLDVVAVAANELYPGSPPTQSVRLDVASGNGSSEGFDHQQVRSALQPGHRYHGEVWMRSGNSGGSPQGVVVSVPIFDAGGFTGNQPGSFAANVGATWSLYAGPQFTGIDGESTNLAFRASADGGEDVVFIALPRIVAPASQLVFRDGFEPDGAATLVRIPGRNF
jgi:hypothetical protein